jgi:hypothetical protein
MQRTGIEKHLQQAIYQHVHALPSTSVNTGTADIKSEFTIACCSQLNKQLLSKSLHANQMNLEMEFNCSKEGNMNPNNLTFCRP